MKRAWAVEVSMFLQKRTRRIPARRSGGFTLIEVMAAVALLFIGILGLTGMLLQAIDNNRLNANRTMTALAVQDRIAGFYRLPRQYLTSKGLDTAFPCDTDGNHLGVDTIQLGPPIKEDLNLQSNGAALPAGQYGYPYLLTMTVFGVCTPDRKDEQGVPRCVTDTTNKAFRGSCPVGQRQVGGMEHNDQTPNTYSVQYTLSQQGTNTKIFSGEFWMSDDPTRFN